MNCDLEVIALAFREGDYKITHHTNVRMQTREISVAFIEEAIGRDSPRIIESYDEGCLILGWGTPSEPLHAVIIYRSTDDIRLVTIYHPDPERWSSNYAQRR